MQLARRGQRFLSVQEPFGLFDLCWEGGCLELILDHAMQTFQHKRGMRLWGSGTFGILGWYRGTAFFPLHSVLPDVLVIQEGLDMFLRNTTTVQSKNVD